jgi:hypothetical protein
VVVVIIGLIVIVGTLGCMCGAFVVVCLYRDQIEPVLVPFSIVDVGAF